MNPRVNNVVGFGCGYVALAVAAELTQINAHFSATTRSLEKHVAYCRLGIESHHFDSSIESCPDRDAIETLLKSASHVLISIPPNEPDFEAALQHFGIAIGSSPNLKWVGYVSSAGVYGNRPGILINERISTEAAMPIDVQRVRAENAWLELWRSRGIPIHIFRLAAFYGPNRSPLDWVRAGRIQRVDVPGVIFSRVHIDDVAQTLVRSMLDPSPGSIYNVADDAPCSSTEVIAYACELLGVPIDPVQVRDVTALPPEMRPFFSESRSLSNAKMKNELGVILKYPDYRSGLRAIHASANDNLVLRPRATFDERIIRPTHAA